MLERTVACGIVIVFNREYLKNKSGFLLAARQDSAQPLLFLSCTLSGRIENSSAVQVGRV